MKTIFQTKKPLLKSLAVLLACFLAFSSCAFSAVAADDAAAVPALLEPVGVKIDVATVERGRLTEITVYDGAVVPYVEELFFPIAGTVEEIHVAVGQEVKAGDVLITLNHEKQTERLEALKEELANLTQNAAYTDALNLLDLDILHMELEKLMHQPAPDSQAIALKELEIREKELAVSFDQTLRERNMADIQSEITRLEEETTQAVLLSPFDGQVMFCAGIKNGSYINAYQPLIYLADNSRLSIESEYITPSLLRSIASVYALIGPNRYEVTHIPADTTEYLSKVLAGETLYSNFSIQAPDAWVTPGVYAAICVEDEALEDALLIPYNALYSDGSGNSYVYVIENGERIRRNIKTGRRTDWAVQILEGLKEGDTVYVKE